jgi:hypothetical protein
MPQGIAGPSRQSRLAALGAVCAVALDVGAAFRACSSGLPQEPSRRQCSNPAGASAAVTAATCDWHAPLHPFPTAPKQQMCRSPRCCWSALHPCISPLQPNPSHTPTPTPLFQPLPLPSHPVFTHPSPAPITTHASTHCNIFSFLTLPPSQTPPGCHGGGPGEGASGEGGGGPH